MKSDFKKKKKKKELRDVRQEFPHDTQNRQNGEKKIFFSFFLFLDFNVGSIVASC